MYQSSRLQMILVFNLQNVTGITEILQSKLSKLIETCNKAWNKLYSET